MNLNFEIVEMKAKPALSIRTISSVANLPMVLGSAYQKIMEHLNSIGEYPSDAPFVAYYNMDMERLDIDVGFPVSRKLPEKEDIKAIELPGGRYVRCIHTGPYSAMEDTYNALMKWMEERHLEAAGTVYEFYLNSPETVPEEKLETRIMFLLA